MVTPNTAPAVNLWMLWFAQLVSVLLLTAIALYLPSLDVVESLPELRMPILIAGGASALAIIVIGRLLGLGRRRDVRVHEIQGVTDASPSLVRWLILFALADLPAILGLVLVFVGGESGHAIALGAASCLILLLYRPAE